MRLKLYLGASTLRKWHIDLLAKLAAQPCIEVAAEISRSTGRPPNVLPPSIEWLFRLETLLHRIPDGGLVSKAPEAALQPYLANSGAFDLVLDLDGNFDAPVDMRVWQLVFNGLPGEVALLSLLISGQSPVAEILERRKVVVVGRLGTEYNGIALASFEDVLARTTSLILAGLTGAAGNKLPVIADSLQPYVPRPITASFLAARSLKKLARWGAMAIYRLCYDSPHWRVGWRKIAGPDVIDLGDHPASGWQDLPDDGSRFYADPFPLHRQGQLTLFVEDFQHRTAKGIISAITFDADGPVGRPEPVLELPYHLSYPFVFVQDNETWMIPESGAAGTIDLFRATKFPGGWVKEATLVSSIVASDATLLQHNGSWWLFATVRDAGGAFSDALYLWSAPDFRGPWSPHPRNPVLIDIASARPAGRIVSRKGQLVRPVQDCRRGYGHALGLARILALDHDHFEQTVDKILTAGSVWPGRRIHSLNSAGGFEFIDGSGQSGLVFGRR